jgi:hypothetical protein
MKEHEEEIHDEAYRVAWIKLLHIWYRELVKRILNDRNP